MKKLSTSLAIIVLIFSLFFPAAGYANSDFPQLREAPWPTSSKPENSAQVKFVLLKLTLPVEYVKSIDIFNFDAPAICLASQDEKKNLFIFLQDENDGYKELYDKAGASNIYQFFKQLGNLDIANGTMRKIRKIYGLDQATAFIHYKKDQLDAYHIQSKDTEQSELFILIADTPHIYKFNGHITNEVVNQLLAHINL